MLCTYRNGPCFCEDLPFTEYNSYLDDSPIGRISIHFLLRLAFNWRAGGGMAAILAAALHRTAPPTSGAISQDRAQPEVCSTIAPRRPNNCNSPS
jgi:hypothetical protein